MSAPSTTNADSVEPPVKVPAGQARGCLELPNAATIIGGQEIVVAGWAFGTKVPASEVELVHDDVVVARVELGEHRPDVAAAFPGQPGADTSGFHAVVKTAELDDADVLVRVVLSDGGRCPLAVLRVRHPEEPIVLDASLLSPAPERHYDLSTAEALRRLRISPAMRWAGGQHDDPPSGTAWQRISGKLLFEPLIQPEFEIERDDRVFAIGSCFARNVEGALEDLGVDVASRSDVFDGIPFRAAARPWDFANKYNTEAIRSELRWALEPGHEFPRDGLLRLPDGTWEDPYATSIFEYTDEESTYERHRLLSGLTRQISECRIVVITLGLIEAFFDTKTGLHTNTTPHLTADPERFRLRVLSFDQVMEGLEDAYELITRYGHADAQIVVTVSPVSPVALAATFTGQDVVLANTLSKSVLRAAAGAWTMRHENVHYFPSYEIVMNSDRTVVWDADGRHVKPPFVRQIMDLFVRTHLTTSDAGQPRLAAEVS